MINALLSSAFRKKLHRHDEHHLFRTHSSHTIFDLICIGVGATLGSGVFVLTGLVAHREAGPSVIISWVIAGIACLFSAMSYAELSGRMPSTGSSYTFVYHTLGEWPAYLTAWCLTLECGISAAAVARNWGVKLTTYFAVAPGEEIDSGPNYFAGLLMLFTTLLFLSGTEVSKWTINVFTMLKVGLVIFMVVAGLCLFSGPNVVARPTFLPFGLSGTVRGATSCFFGFVGYDEICCLALETDNPRRNVPVSVFGTIGIVTMFYLLTSVALVGMQPYSEIDPDSGFSQAFLAHHWYTASAITGIGELVSLPLVVLVSFLPQPRICAALAEDRLLPACFLATSTNGTSGNTGNQGEGEGEGEGVLVTGVVVCGLLCLLVALWLPFGYLDDLISGGVLLALIMTNNALLLYRCNNTLDLPYNNNNNNNSTNNNSNNNNNTIYNNTIYNSNGNSRGHRGYAALEHTNNNNNNNNSYSNNSDSNSYNNSSSSDSSDSDGMYSMYGMYYGMYSMKAILYSWSRCEIVLFLFNLECLLLSLALHLLPHTSSPPTTTTVVTAGQILCYTILLCLLVYTARTFQLHCPSLTSLTTTSDSQRGGGTRCYEVPGVPYTPMLGMLINYALLSQLPAATLWGLLLFFVTTSLLYVLQKVCMLHYATAV